MASICIDLGGTNIKAGLIKDETLVITDSIPSLSQNSFKEVTANLEKMIRRIVSKSGVALHEIKAIGMAIPGIVDVNKNRVIDINAKHMEAVQFNFNAWCKGKFNLPIILDNDARAALAGVWQYGTGKGCDNIVMMTLGTGVGTAALINGKLLYGKHFQAGCLGGHFTVNYNGAVCNCGNTGCLESEASSWRLRDTILKHKNGSALLKRNNNNVDFEKLFQLMQEGDKVATSIINFNLKVWSAGAVSLIHAYDPELIILSGGIMKSKDVVLPFIQKYIAKYAWTPAHQVTVKASVQTGTMALWGMHFLINNKTDNFGI